MKYLSSWMLFESRNPNDIRKFNKKEKLTVYHRTEDEIVSKVGRDGFRSGGGNAWGDGIYACYDLISTTKKNPYNEGQDRVNTYGPVIIESEVVSLKDYLIFDYDAAKQYYGKDYDLITQIKNLVPKEVFESNKESIESAHNICLSHRDKPLGESKYTTSAVGIIYYIAPIMDHVRGIVFTGAWDGKVLLSYDRENLIPVRYSKDNGKNWKKITEKGAYKAAKENFLKLISDESDIEKIKAKIKDRINNTITTRFGPTKNLKNLNFNELKSIRSDFSYIYQDSANNRVVYPEQSKKYEDYKKTLDIIRKEIDDVFLPAFDVVKKEVLNFIDSINWSDDISEIIKSVNNNLDFANLYKDFENDSSVIEKLNEIRKKIIFNFIENINWSDDIIEIFISINNNLNFATLYKDFNNDSSVIKKLDETKKKITEIYLKEYKKNLLNILKEEAFFVKFIEFSKKYKYVPSTLNDRIFDNTYLSMNNFFDSVVNQIKEVIKTDEIGEITTNFTDNLEKKVAYFLNNHENRYEVKEIAIQKPNDEVYKDLDFQKFSKDYKYLYIYQAVSIANYDFDRILEQIKSGIITVRENLAKDFKIDEYIEELKLSLQQISSSQKTKFDKLNSNVEGMINKCKNYQELYEGNLTKTYSDIWNGISNADEYYCNFPNFIFFISAIEDRSILDRLTKEGFLTEKTSKILKMLFLQPVSKTNYDTKKETFSELTDYQKSQSNKEYQLEFNNPEFAPLFKAILPNEKNFRCFKKLKLEGKDVSNWTNWIKIYLLSYVMSFGSTSSIYIRFNSDELREKYSLDEVLNQLINLNLNIFSKKFFESEELKMVTYGGEIDYNIKTILNTFTFRINKDDQNTINKNFQYLDKIKDKIEKELYYRIIFSLTQVLKDGENFDKLINLIDTKSEEFFTILNKQKQKDGYDELLKIFLQKNIISLSDCLKNNLDASSTVEKFANYKLRKIIEENNLEKIKSFLDFLKQNKISVLFKNSKELSSYGPFPFEKIDIKLLPIEVIEKMIENEQIEFRQISEDIGKNEELVRKLMKFINKEGFERLLNCVEDPKLKEEIMIKRLEISNNFSINFNTFKEFGPKRVNLEKLIKDFNETCSDSDEDYFFEILLILLSTDKKDEILRKIDKNAFNYFLEDFSPEEDDFKKWGNEKFIEGIKSDVPALSEFITTKNMVDAINIMKKYVPDPVKIKCQRIIDMITYTSERIILSYKSFRRI